MGTTSACAENTPFARGKIQHAKNYLRVRGEYYFTTGDGSVWLELPPRARRIRFSFKVKTNIFGTTSACAENTPHQSHHPQANRNYLRVRGEYIASMMKARKGKELPPRARRIPIASN